MSKPRKQKQQVVPEMTAVERLGLRVSSMINSPQAQQRRSALIHRLDTDEDREWDEVMEMLAETDGLGMTFQDDGNVLLTWEAPSEDDRPVEVMDLDITEATSDF